MITISEERAAAVARWAVLVAIAGTALFVLRPIASPFALSKATLGGLCAIVGLGAVAWRTSLRRRWATPFAPSLVAAGAFLALGAVAVLTSDVVWRSVVGQRGRASGYGLYVVCALLLFLTLLAFGGQVDRIRLVARAGVVAVGGVAGYCLLQKLNADPLTWPAGSLPLFSTIGNPDGVSGYVGAALPLAAYIGVADEDRRWRIAGLAAAVAGVLAVLVTRSFQGVPAGIAGMAVLAWTWLPMAAPAIRRWVLGGLAAAVALSAVIVVAGLTGAGPFQKLSGDVGFAQRQYYWQAAADMVADEPLTGVGFDSFGSYYRQHRPDASVGVFGLSQTADEPHDVPLAMFTGGGLPLGVAYLSFVVLVGFALFGGLRRLDADRRLLLGGLGGAWVGYQVQSLVSVESPAAAVLHWVMAAAVLLVAGAISWHQWGAPPPDAGATKQRQQPPTRTHPPVGVIAAIVVVCAALMWWTTIPARADWHGRRSETAGDLFTADHELRKAIAIAPWEADYWSRQGKLVSENGQPKDAFRLFDEAVRRERSSFANLLNSARAAHGALKEDIAEDRYLKVLEIEPRDPDLRAEVGAFYLDIGDPKQAVTYIRDALARATDKVKTNIDLGRALVDLKQVDDARSAFDAAMGQRPKDPLLAQKVGAILAKGGYESDAIDVLRTFLRDQDPTDAKTMALLGELLLNTSDREEGVALLTTAHEQMPQDAAITDAYNRATNGGG